MMSLNDDTINDNVSSLVEFELLELGVYEPVKQLVLVMLRSNFGLD